MQQNGLAPRHEMTTRHVHDVTDDVAARCHYTYTGTAWYASSVIFSEPHAWHTTLLDIPVALDTTGAGGEHSEVPF